MICLDSCFLVDFFRGDISAVSKLRDVARNESIGTTAINAAEFLLGMYSARNIRREHAIRAFDFFDGIEVLDLDMISIIKSCGLKEGLMKKGKVINQNDLLIAGIMLKNGCNMIITRDTKDFDKIQGIKAVTY
ncbi:type II toxin-antitoxin system VapC family toxin [Candidatus Woesearchaeota archaeon]|nr:type II toxin-antitoxin system VapC family toxin [Candidatus Woesearchaeota archaeon]